MYFWNTEKLAEEIKNNKVSEEEWKNYYLATSIFSLFIFLGSVVPRTGGVILPLVEAIFSIAITVFGINFTYKTNTILNGGNYVSRVTALGFPILIKLCTLSLLFGAIFGGLIGGHLIEAGSDRIPKTIFTLAIQAVFFWRINFHLKNINT